MVQGGHGKLGKAKSAVVARRSAGAQRRKTVKAARSTRKGGGGGGSASENDPGIVAATKAINRKNERIIAAKACTGGTRFFLKDIAEKGKNESRRQTATRDKRQSKPKIADRLKDQIKKLT